MSNREIDFYGEVIDRFTSHIEEFLPSNFELVGLHNQLPLCGDFGSMIKVLEKQFSIKIENHYFPRLKIDALLASKDQENRIRMIMIEVKYGNPLRLIDYSQLIGYLQIAKVCIGGALVLVADKKMETISTDFLKVIELRQVDLAWRVSHPHDDHGYKFKAGLALCDIGNGTHLLDTKNSFGIAEWSEFADLLVNSDQFLNAEEF
jgi:hypothetical protein